MKCPGCNTDIADSAQKCPFCKEPIGNEASEKFRNFNFKYTITSKEQIKIIRDTVNELSESVAAETAKAPNTEKKPRARITIKRRAKNKKSTSPKSDTVSKTDTAKTHTSVNGGTAEKKRPFGALDTNGKLRLGVWGFMITAIIFVTAVVCLAVGLVGSHETTFKTYVYSKGNELYALHEGKSVKLSSSAVDEDYLTKMSVYADKISAAEVLGKTKTYAISKNGRYVYYLENFNPEKACGDLYRIEKGKPSTKLKIAASVNNSLVLSEKGNSLMFLCSTDSDGNMGVLYFWEKGMREPHKITTDIDGGTFVFSNDGKSAVFIQNLDHRIMQGDLYTQNLKKLKEDREHIDSGVCRIFGTTSDSKYCIYAKNYDVNDDSFEIFSLGGKNGLLSLGGRTRTAPVICGGKNCAYILEAENDGTNTLCKVAVSSGKKEKIADGVSSDLPKLADNGKSLLFSRLYDKNTADFYVCTSGKQPVKIAENVTSDSSVRDIPQFAYTQDLKIFVYISNYNTERGGILFASRLGREPEKLAEGVHSCYIGENGSIIYTKDFSEARKTADVYAVHGGKTILLKKEIYPSSIIADEKCKNIFCITDYDTERGVGTLETVNSSADSRIVDKDVFGIDAADFGELFYYKNLGTEDGGSFDLYLLPDSKSEPIAADKGVQTVGTR